MIFFECYADEVFLKVLGFSKKSIEHSFGRSRVCFKLSNAKNSMGLIDEDPNSPKEPYLRYLYGFPPIFEDESITFFYDKKSNNKMLVIRPNLEEWSLKLAKDRNIDLGNVYNLSNDVKKLHNDLAFYRNIQKFNAFEALLNSLSDHKTIIKIKELIKM